MRAYALVDDADRHLLEKGWHLTADGYAARNAGYGRSGRTVIRMHREVLGLSQGDGLEVDHINGNPLDNRRENLRAVTRAQQMQNTRPRVQGSSRYRGVDLHRATGLWRARCTIGGRHHCVGYFRDEDDAGAAAAAFRAEHMPFAVER